MRRFIVSSANEIISDIKKAREKFNREISVITITSMRFVDFSEVFDEITNLIGLMFDDVEKDDDVNGLYAITDLQANDIVRFVKRTSNNAIIFVQCDGGVSRSAGVCAALRILEGWTDSGIFASRKYCPNWKCYTSVLRAGGVNRFDDSKLELNMKIFSRRLL